MKRRGLLKQLLLFFIVGFVLTSIYNSAVIRQVEQPPKEIQTPTSVVPNVPALTSLHRLPINCQKIIEYDKDEIDRANAYMKVVQPVRWQSADYINKTNDCVTFRKSMRYDAFPITNEEKNFPIAFSIITYKDIDQTEKLLRSIYRPHNFYCIHVDGSSARDIHKAARAIADCFGNVFIVSKTEDIIYNHMTRLKADLNCMSDLLSISEKWKYLMNLPHQQFPLKTNLEIVKILKIYNGANDIEGIQTLSRMVPNRFQFSHRYDNKTWMIYKRNKEFKLPYNASLVKGSAYGVFSRAFVQYVIKNKQAKNILGSLEDVKSPDEYYWATLNHNKVLKAPGRFLGKNVYVVKSKE